MAMMAAVKRYGIARPAADAQAVGRRQTTQAFWSRSNDVMTHWMRGLGPGLLVTAAFIGPGTVITASKAGAEYGWELMWTVLFAVAAAMILQEMAARLGVVARQGLGEAIRESLPQPAVRVLAMILVVSAIAIGNAAFQYGNVTGAVSGVLGAFDQAPDWTGRPWMTLAVGVIAFGLLATGSVKAIQVALSCLVAVMSLVFIVTAFLTPTDWSAVAEGVVPQVPKGSIMTVLGLIGTTVVPYNLFLHASAARERWATDDRATSLQEARFGTFVAIAIGGLITMSILFVAAGSFPKGTKLAASDELLAHLGVAGQWLFALGLFSAGLTSAVTAPLAAAYATSGIIGFDRQQHPWVFRAVWFLVLVIGAGCAIVLDASPAAGIVFAQATNGLLLPLVALFLFWVVNRRKIMGEYTNGWVSNVLGFVIIGITIVLGCRSLYFAYTGVMKFWQD